MIVQNYAGDLLLPSAMSAISTTLSVFSRCRLFRETPAPVDLGTEDFTNLVIFCTKSPEAFIFREPVESDFLGSPARRQHLVPRHEVDGASLDKLAMAERPLIRQGQLSDLQASQMRSAVGHWHVMRNVLPAVIWENW